MGKPGFKARSQVGSQTALPSTKNVEPILRGIAKSGARNGVAVEYEDSSEQSDTVPSIEPNTLSSDQ
jgi:hypothetical protein